MSNYNNLKTTIDANIKQNGNQEITGPILNSVLNQMVNILGTGYQFAGIATLDPATEPGTPDAKVFYIANGKGTYTNFGGLEVTEDDVVVLYWDTTWHKVATGIASQAKLSELDSKLNIAKNTGYFDDKIINQRAVSKKLDDLSMAIGVTEITLTADDFSDMIWNHSSILKSNADYNSFIIRVPSSVKVSYSATYLSNQALFNEAPILNKSYTEQKFYGNGIIPEGYSYLLINIALAKYDNSPLVVTIENNGLRKELSDSVKRLTAFDKRLTDAENTIKDIKIIVGNSENTINLMTSDYSGLGYSGTAFFSSNSTYDSFILPLNAGIETQIINNTGLSHANAGLVTVYTFSDAPVIGEMEYIRKGGVDFHYNSFTPLDNEKYICITINKTKYSDNNYSFKTDGNGLVKRVENLENSINSLKGKKIVCFGDSLTEMKSNVHGRSYSEYIAEFSGAEVINIGIGGSQLRRRANFFGVFDPNEHYQATTGNCIYTDPSTGETRLYNFTSEHQGEWSYDDVRLSPWQQLSYSNLDVISLIEAAASQSFTDIIAACKVIKETQSDDNTAIIDALVAIDWSKVDAITIFAGTNDWYNANTLGETGSNNPKETLGAINEIIRIFLTTYPHIKIFWFTPIVRWLAYNGGSTDDSQFSDNYSVEGNGTLKEECAAIINEVTKNHLPICDMYNNFGWNKYNCTQYFTGTDGTHPRTEAGVTYIATKILNFLLANKTF